MLKSVYYMTVCSIVAYPVYSQ